MVLVVVGSDETVNWPVCCLPKPKNVREGDAKRINFLKMFRPCVDPPKFQEGLFQFCIALNVGACMYTTTFCQYAGIMRRRKLQQIKNERENIRDKRLSAIYGTNIYIYMAYCWLPKIYTNNKFFKFSAQ